MMLQKQLQNGGGKVARQRRTHCVSRATRSVARVRILAFGAAAAESSAATAGDGAKRVKPEKEKV